MGVKIWSSTFHAGCRQRVYHYTQKDYRTELYYFRIIFGNSCSVITEPKCFWNCLVSLRIVNRGFVFGIMLGNLDLVHRNRSDFAICDCDAYRGSQKSLVISETLHCDWRVRWKVASDSRFQVAISEPETPFFLWDFWRFGSVYAEIASDCECAILVRQGGGITEPKLFWNWFGNIFLGKSKRGLTNGGLSPKFSEKIGQKSFRENRAFSGLIGAFSGPIGAFSGLIGTDSSAPHSRGRQQKFPRKGLFGPN